MDSISHLQGIQRQATDGYSREVCGKGGTYTKSGRMVGFRQADKRTRLSGSPAGVLALGHKLSTRAGG